MNPTQKTIFFIDQTSEGDHHMMFNASFINILSTLYLGQKLHYLGINSSQKKVAELLSDVDTLPLEISSIKYLNTKKQNVLIKIFYFILKEFQRFLAFLKIFNRSKKNDVIYLSITTFSSFLFFKISSFFYKRTIFTILHGDIDFLYKTNNLHQKTNALCHRLIFKLKKKNFKYIVLNKISKSILVKDGFLNEHELIEINHPYLFKNDAATVIFRKPIKFAHNGSMEIQRKNSHYIYKLAESLMDQVNTSQIEFSSIGLATQQMNPYLNSYVKMVVGKKKDNLPPYLSRETYESELTKVNYLLFFFPENEYIFRASGAVIDAIAFQKPIIALKHPFFDNIFEQGGNIGYICNSVKEMHDLIFNITQSVENYTDAYQSQVSNLKKFKFKFGVTHISNDLHQQNIT